MKIELFPFQADAVGKLRQHISNAVRYYNVGKQPQIVSLSAPTGAGKTVIMSALIELIYSGDPVYVEQPNAIFLWLSDSPELNLQSKEKLDTKADKLQFGQSVVVDADTFDKDVLEDGKVYFLNTQKLGAKSKLVTHSDNRQHTIWETIANTVEEKADRLYVIIDEAHRGMQNKNAAEAQSIMQKFLLGSKADGLPPMPIVIGMSATVDRFNKFAVNATNSMINRVVVTPDSVRSSGLLKDKIIIGYPEDDSINADASILQAATDEWIDKCKHWDVYCKEQHYAQVRPVFIIQVCAGTKGNLTDTNLEDVIAKISECVGEPFADGEIVHTFGQTTASLDINGICVNYVEPSKISDDRRIKVVLFKQNLSTGWDCPRAECLLSYQHAEDATYIAQLLGRAIRTPLQQHVNVDDSLNNVHLYLPYFNEKKVSKIIEDLQKAEGGDIPTEISGEAVGQGLHVTLSVKKPELAPDVPVVKVKPGKIVEDAAVETPVAPVSVQPTQTESPVHHEDVSEPETEEVKPVASSVSPVQPVVTPAAPRPAPKPHYYDDGLDREKIVDFIRGLDLVTNRVRPVQTNDYLKSLYSLVRFLVQSKLDMAAYSSIRADIAKQIHDYIQELKDSNRYDELVSKISTFKLGIQVINAFGQKVGNSGNDLFSVAESDIDRMFRLAEANLGCEGVGVEYGRLYGDEDDPAAYKTDVILFVDSDECMERLHTYAEYKYHTLNNQYRRAAATLPENWYHQYEAIVISGDAVSELPYNPPRLIDAYQDKDGKSYTGHLYVNETTGLAKFNLNGWERKVIELESGRDDFVCWVRNTSRAKYALCIAYADVNGDKSALYPDFLVVRKDQYGYVLDILEPHNPNFDDNLGKAQGLAEYARKYGKDLGRVALIREIDGHLRYLNLADSKVMHEVLNAKTQGELNSIFDKNSV